MPSALELESEMRSELDVVQPRGAQGVERGGAVIDPESDRGVASVTEARVRVKAQVAEGLSRVGGNAVPSGEHRRVGGEALVERLAIRDVEPLESGGIAAGRVRPTRERPFAGRV